MGGVVKKPYRVKIRTEYIVEMEVDAENENEAKDLCLGGYERTKEETMVDIEVIETYKLEEEHD